MKEREALLHFMSLGEQWRWSWASDGLTCFPIPARPFSSARCVTIIFERIASAADYTSRLQGFRGLEFRSSEDIKCPQQTLLLSRLPMSRHNKCNEATSDNSKFDIPNSKRIFSLEQKWWCKCDKDSLKKESLFSPQHFIDFSELLHFSKPLRLSFGCIFEMYRE